MKKILVIEDDEQSRYLISFILKKNGHEVVEDKRGEDALDMVVKENPDLILMDIQLPGIDGLETTKRIRESGVDRNIPIIAITSYAMVGDREKALAAGCNGYIEKPINPETIMDEINSYL